MGYKLKIAANVRSIKEDLNEVSCNAEKDYDVSFNLPENHSNFSEIGKVVKSLIAAKLQESGFVKAGRETCFYIEKSLTDSLNFRPTESNSVLEIESPHKVAQGLSVDLLRLLKDYSKFEIIGASGVVKGMFLILDREFEKAFTLEFGIVKNEK